MHTLKERFDQLESADLSLEGISILPIRDDYDLWFATVECRLASGQEDHVNPAGFSIGRAWLNPASHIPCIIRHGTTRIGYIVLRKWVGSEATSWSYYLDVQHQGKGLGKTAARLAVKILKTAMPELPIKLSTEKDNEKAQRLYRSIGFQLSHELDGDDLVFVYE
jgi:diamine N-acetyltransferase